MRLIVMCVRVVCTSGRVSVVLARTCVRVGIVHIPEGHCTLGSGLMISAFLVELAFIILAHRKHQNHTNNCENGDKNK